MNTQSNTGPDGLLQLPALTVEQFATVLAALRAWARIEASGPPERMIADDLGTLTALSGAQVQALADLISQRTREPAYIPTVLVYVRGGQVQECDATDATRVLVLDQDCHSSAQAVTLHGKSIEVTSFELSAPHERRVPMLLADIATAMGHPPARNGSR